jgi:hypothetical protein
LLRDSLIFPAERIGSTITDQIGLIFRFVDLCTVCEKFFGKPRNRESSHKVYKTPWQGDPRINIQNHKGKAKAYQVKQVLMAIERVEVNYGTE